MGTEGVEPSCAFARYPLKIVCLPFHHVPGEVQKTLAVKEGCIGGSSEIHEECPEAESNRRHADFQSTALPTELSGPFEEEL